MMIKFTAIKNQKGAALVIGMVVLLVMTLLGVSSMSSITTELKMANNSQTHTTGFQIAASGIYAALDTTSAIAIDTAAAGTQVVVYTAPDGYSKSTITATYSACVLVPEGFSLSQDVTMKGIVQDISSMAQVFNSGGELLGTTTHVNGIQTIRPGCPTGASPQ